MESQLQIIWLICSASTHMLQYESNVQHLHDSRYVFVTVRYDDTEFMHIKIKIKVKHLESIWKHRGRCVSECT